MTVLPYNARDPQSILAFAKKLKGKKFGAVLPQHKFGADSVHDKGGVGGFYESYFGIKTNSIAEPDFRDAGVELKSVPIIKRKRDSAVKERTKITSINYAALVKETWATASLRKKISHVLFIFYEHVPDAKKEEFITIDAVLWRPSPEDERFFRSDWSVVWRMVYDGEAHKLSESLTDYIGACTSGTGALVKQPNSSTLAKQRSFAFKPAFTRQIWEKEVLHVEFESLVKTLNITDITRFEQAIIDRLRTFEGNAIGALAKRFNVTGKGSKQYKSTVIRRILGAKKARSKLEEFEKQGITVKILPVNERTGKPFEALSFSAFKHMELIEETWEESELREATEKMLIIPVIGPDKKNVDDFKLGKAFFWSPNDEESSIMKREWESFVGQIREGHADRLPTAKSTTMIHIRPHGRNAADTDSVPGGKKVTKKCFWLNSDFLASLLGSRAGVKPVPLVKRS